MRVTACLALLAASAGVRAANAGALEDGAERYRPYLIEGVASALAGARALRERAAAADLPGARKAWLSARAGWERSEVFTAGLRPRARCADRRLAERGQRVSRHRGETVRGG
ncbi:imelysin family protein [Bradyrhizobium sp. JR3.5]